MKKIALIWLAATGMLMAQTQNVKVAGNPDDIINIASIDKKPEYPGGLQEFYKFIGNNYRMPDHPEMESGRVMVSFVIEKDGSLTDIKVLRDVGFGSGEEAVRVLKQSPKWIPGEQNGKPVRVSYALPIKINAPELDPVIAEGDATTKPQFPGGEKAFQKHFADNLKIKGKHVIHFVVEANSMPTFLKCPEMSDDDCKEIKRVLLLAPYWKAGTKGKRLARIAMTRTIEIN